MISKETVTCLQYGKCINCSKYYRKCSSINYFYSKLILAPKDNDEAHAYVIASQTQENTCQEAGTHLYQGGFHLGAKPNIFIYESYWNDLYVGAKQFKNGSVHNVLTENAIPAQFTVFGVSAVKIWCNYIEDSYILTEFSPF